MHLPRKVSIFEVGPRDGLQNEPILLPIEKKLRFLEGLVLAGCRNLEVGAFVREDRVRQMADTDELFKKIQQSPVFLRANGNSKNGPILWALVPNDRGLERAMAVNCRAIAVFLGVTEKFNEKNIGVGVSGALRIYERVVARARKEKLKVRGYLSVVWGCPYEGKVPSKKSIAMVRRLLNLGVEEVSLGDTIGVAAPIEVQKLLLGLKKEVKAKRVAGHFHDTRGTAIANCLAALEVGLTTLDSSSAGLGGCNYAPGAAGNVSSEDLVYMLQRMGIQTGIDLDLLAKAGAEVAQALGRVPFSKYLQAWTSTQGTVPALGSEKLS